MSHALFVGVATLDVIQQVDNEIKPDSENYSLRTLVCAGGGATNAAVTYAKLGGDAQLITRLGDDALGDNVISLVEGDGVRPYVVRSDSHETVVATIIPHKTTGDRTIIASGNKSLYRGDESKSFPEIDEIVASSLIVEIDGYETDIAFYVVRKAHELGIPVVADFGRFRPECEKLLPYVTFAIVSGDYNPGKDVGQHLRSLGVKYVAVTHGGKDIEFLTPCEIVPVPVPSVSVVDTLGAGDILRGAVTYFYERLLQLEPDAINNEYFALKALELGVVVASASVMFFGTREWAKNMVGEVEYVPDEEVFNLSRDVIEKNQEVYKRLSKM